MSSKDAPRRNSRFDSSRWFSASLCGFMLAAAAIAHGQVPRATTGQKAAAPKQAAPNPAPKPGMLNKILPRTAGPAAGPVAPATATAPATAPTSGKQSAAIVNGEPISSDQLANECLRRF